MIFGGQSGTQSLRAAVLLEPSGDRPTERRVPRSESFPAHDSQSISPASIHPRSHRCLTDAVSCARARHDVIYRSGQRREQSSAKPCRITTANSEPASVAAAAPLVTALRCPRAFDVDMAARLVVTHGNPGHRRPLRVKSSSTTSDSRHEATGRRTGRGRACSRSGHCVQSSRRKTMSGRRMRPQDF